MFVAQEGLSRGQDGRHDEGRLVSLGQAAEQGFEGRRFAGARRMLALVAGILGTSLGLSTATQDANANGETRSLTMHHAHTNELITITYKRFGSFDSAALEKLNWFLRDWRVDEPISMSPQLFDVIWFVYREVGASEPIKVMSAYRSPGTNAMLRRRSRAVAKESQHMRGNAMDIHIPGVSMAKVREIGMRLQRGGVGYYPSAGSPFVHLDIGSVRSWPRMNRDQLERIFPDGKTVHLPSDGVPLANYQAALAEVQARGGSALDYDTVTSNRGKSLWALLFGSDTDEDANEVAPGRGRAGRAVAARRGSAGSTEPTSYASSGDGVNAWGAGAMAPVPQVAAAPVPRIARMAVNEPAAPAAETPVAASPPASRAQPGIAPEPPALQIAALPVPPIRPRGAQFERMVAANEPLPPIRPGALTTLATLAPLPAEPQSAVPAPVPAGNVPLPPVRPALAAQVAAAPMPAETAVASPPVLQSVTAPLPPLRPVVLAAAPAAPSTAQALPGIVSRAEPQPGLAHAYAAIVAPLPPSRPVPAAAPPPPSPAPQPAAAPVRPPVVAAPAPLRKTNPSVLAAERPEAETRPSRVTAVAEPPVAREVRSGVVAMKFQQGPAVGISGFGGSFIRPLGASFTKAGE